MKWIVLMMISLNLYYGRRGIALDQIKEGIICILKKLIINPKLAKGHYIFFLKRYNTVIIVSELIKNLFEEHNISGLKFDKVM